MVRKGHHTNLLITLPLLWYFPVMLTPTSLSGSCRPLPWEPSRQPKSPAPLPTERLTCDVDAELVILVLNLHGGGGHHENHGEAGAASRPHAPPPPSWGWLRDERHDSLQLSTRPPTATATPPHFHYQFQVLRCFTFKTMLTHVSSDYAVCLHETIREF